LEVSCLCAWAIVILWDYSEKSLVSNKGTGLLPDCRRNQDKLFYAFLFSLYFFPGFDDFHLIHLRPCLPLHQFVIFFQITKNGEDEQNWKGIFWHKRELTHAGVRNMTERGLSHVGYILTWLKLRWVIHIRELTHVNDTLVSLYVSERFLLEKEQFSIYFYQAQNSFSFVQHKPNFLLGSIAQIVILKPINFTNNVLL